MNAIGKLLVIAGGFLTLIGLLIWFGPKVPWLGRLPGDIWVRKNNFTVYFPLGTCILVSMILTFILWLLRK